VVVKKNCREIPPGTRLLLEVSAREPFYGSDLLAVEALKKQKLSSNKRGQG